jgi:hypothetical protein
VGYFDAHLEDGAKLVIVFMNKDLASQQKPLAPLVRLNLDLADGRSVEKLATYEQDALISRDRRRRRSDRRQQVQRRPPPLPHHREHRRDRGVVLSGALLAAGLAATTFVRGGLASQTNIRGVLGRVRFDR